jgi:hypothetical protein
MIEGALTHWRTSSFCAHGNCLEVADLGETIGLRSSWARNGAELRLPRPVFAAFVLGLQDGDLSRSSVRPG